MLPTNSIFSTNRIISNFYYKATKRSIFNQTHISAATSRTNLKDNSSPSPNNLKLFNQQIRLVTGNYVANDEQQHHPQHVDLNNGAEEPRSTNRKLASLYFQEFPNYCQMVQDAKSRARRSILIDHGGNINIDLRTELNNVEHVYSIERANARGVSRLSLIEFKTENDAICVAKGAKHNEGLLPVPLTILRYNGKGVSVLDNQELPFPVDCVGLSSSKDKPSTLLCSYSDLIASNMMSLIALKMRFITLVNFERILCSGVFDEYELMPFGSSVIDFGTDLGDLDLVVTRKGVDHDKFIMKALSTQHKSLYEVEPQSKLLHLDKSLYSEAKDESGIRGAMRWFNYVLREYMPLTDGYNVIFVPYAKVPIIKFTSRVTGIDCDLSFNLGINQSDADPLSTNYAGIAMAQILYSLCRQNDLFAAVVIYLKMFAKLTGITSKQPSIGFSSFQFLSLIIFYLQQLSMTNRKVKIENKGDSISQQQQRRHSPEKENRVLEVELMSKSRVKIPIIASFKDLPDRKFHTVKLDNNQIDQILPEVITGFYEFYSHLDFENCSLNLYNGRLERKLDNSSIFVQNPIDRSSNICHNVNKRGLDNFIQQIRKASESQISPLSHIRFLSNNSQKQPKKMVEKCVNQIFT